MIVAVFADDQLMERLVLKGGTALSLVHEIGDRASLDVDLSLEDDFEDLSEAKARLFRALTDRLDSAGYEAFDLQLTPRPANPEGRPSTWGGYRLEFKLHDKSRGQPSLQDKRRSALETGGLRHERKFRIEISKHEYCAEKEAVVLDGYRVYVYPPGLIAAEKIRALCQQLPEYPLVRNKHARARDVYDLHQLVKRGGVDLDAPSFKRSVRRVFEAKEVPLSLIGRIAGSREFHRPDWPAVRDSVSKQLESFDTYFDWLVEELQKLEPLGDE